MKWEKETVVFSTNLQKIQFCPCRLVLTLLEPGAQLPIRDMLLLSFSGGKLSILQKQTKSNYPKRCLQANHMWSTHPAMPPISCGSIRHRHFWPPPNISYSKEHPLIHVRGGGCQHDFPELQQSSPRDGTGRWDTTHHCIHNNPVLFCLFNL